MFESVLDEYIGMTDQELDNAIRASELAARSHAARHAALVAVAEARGVHQADGHRSMTAYLRATCNTSGGRIATDR